MNTSKVVFGFFILLAATLNAGTTFPMASTFKIAVAGRIFERIDKGELTLEQMVTVDPKLLVGSYGMAIQTPHPGVSLSVYNLLEFMLTQSDNTSTDVLVQLAGGPGAVTAWLRAQGISGQRVDSDTAHLIYRAMGIENPSLPTFKENVEAAYKADPALRDRGPNVPFNADPRDASTPEAMVQLLLRIRSGKAMSAKSTRTLIGIMERCRPTRSSRTRPARCRRSRTTSASSRSRTAASSPSPCS